MKTNGKSRANSLLAKTLWLAGIRCLILVVAYTILSTTCFAAASSTTTSPSSPLTTTGATSPVSKSPAVSPTGGTGPTDGTKDLSSSSDWFVIPIGKVLKALEEFISGVLRNIGVTFGVVVALVMFWRPLRELLEALTKAIQDRAVTVEVRSVKVQVAERQFDSSQDRLTLFSRSPFEIAPDTPHEGSSVLGEVAPQLEFQVSDYVGRYWSGKGDGSAATRMREARSILLEACKNGTDVTTPIENALTTFAENLEAARFLEAGAFSELLNEYRFLSDWLHDIKANDLNADRKNFLILHCAGVAYAQAGAWADSKVILDRIVWKDSNPCYLPGGDVWLSSTYHEYVHRLLKITQKLDLAASEFIETVREFLNRGLKIYSAMSEADWTRLPITASNKGYYKREILKAMGSIASILGDYSQVPEHKKDYFVRAQTFLEVCTTQIDKDPPSPLDHNNLADLYHQLGYLYQQSDYYKKAHEELNKAFIDEDPDPVFFSTRALIFWREHEPLKGLLALDQFGEAKARQGNNQTIEQYLRNQIFAAKLAVDIDPANNFPRLSLATSILECARRFLDAKKYFVADSAAHQLQAEIDEMLGFAYLQLPGNESRATEAFDRLCSRPDVSAGTEVLWRRRLGRAKAFTYLARSQRRNFASQLATEQLAHGHAELAHSDEEVKVFGVDGSVPDSRKNRNFRLRLDTVVAIQALADESFYENDLKAAGKLLEQQNTILISLQMSLATDTALKSSLADELAKIQSQVRLYEARRCFLLGSILIRSDPLFSDAGLIGKVETLFNAARGVNAELDCRIDLEFGELLLGFSLTGKGDVHSLYQRAVQSVELAATRNSPALRAETIRALADVYAKHSVISRNAKGSKPAA